MKSNRYQLMVCVGKNSLVLIATYTKREHAVNTAKAILQSAIIAKGDCVEVCVWDSRKGWESENAWQVFVEGGNV
jgi:hypothetical protein